MNDCINRKRISIYIADINDWTEDELKAYVCNERISYASKYRQEKDRVRSLMVETLLNYGIKNNYPNIPIPVVITHNKVWKPDYSEEYLDKLCQNNIINIVSDNMLPGHRILGLPYFSMSHAGDYAVVAISDNPVGIDIERCSRGHSEGIADHFFTENERKRISHAENPTEIFFKYWTLKECFLKITGEGLNKGLDSFEITPVEASAKPSDEKEIYQYIQEYDDNIYTGYSLLGPDDYALSVCCINGVKRGKAGSNPSEVDIKKYYVNKNEIIGEKGNL